MIDLDEDMDSDEDNETRSGVRQDDSEESSADSDADADADADAEGEVDEEMSLYLKPPEEQDEILGEIADLEDTVTQLNPDYKIVDRLGTGTFSSVYKAVDLGYHTKWDNDAWLGHHPSFSSAHYQSVPRPEDGKAFVAIKRIYVTSNPERIRNEITIMEDCRGARHISQLITAFRQEDQVVAIMPYHKNEDFRDFYRSLPIEGVKAYFRSAHRPTHTPYHHHPLPLAIGGRDPSAAPSSSSRLSPVPPTTESYAADIDNALDLLEKIMDPLSVKRYTPEAALDHPFLLEGEDMRDDELFPHPFGEGVCGEWHFIDEVTEDLCVRIDNVASRVQNVQKVKKLEDITADLATAPKCLTRWWAAAYVMSVSQVRCRSLLRLVPAHVVVDADAQPLTISLCPALPMVIADLFPGSFAQFAANPFVQQLAPLLVLLLIPFLVFSAQAQLRHFLWWTAHMIRSITSLLPWGSYYDVSESELKPVRTRAAQLARARNPEHHSEKTRADDDAYYYPGLVNVSGTYCFMNSTIQALASLSYLQPYIESLHAKAEAFDVPTPVTDVLRDLLHALNTPKSSRSSIRPVDLIQVLSNHEPGRKSPLFSSREHQDAQELFQLVSECIKKEAAAVDSDVRRDRGFGDVSQEYVENMPELSKTGVFDGLTANRRSCVQCGYTEAVMHFSFDNWQLSVPRLAASCSLEDCLADYTRLEILTDCICRKCSILATYQKLTQEAEKQTGAANGDAHVSSSKKKRAREARKLLGRVKAALDEGRLEDDLKGIKMEKVFSSASTKQAMVARPPSVLVLHLNRSMHFGGYASKNSLRIAFPEFLDLTPFMTSGKLSTSPSVPISSPLPSAPCSTTPSETQRVLYRLSAVVSHYGQHSFGHYICYRRKPRPPSAGARRFAPPQIPHFLECDCERCRKYGPVRDGEDEEAGERPGKGWLRISDDTVSECGVESVLSEGSGAFMLFYERIVQQRPVPRPAQSPRRTSTPDAEPQDVQADDAGAQVLPSEKQDTRPAVTDGFTPRIVRSVAAGRGRAKSAGTNSRSVSEAPPVSVAEIRIPRAELPPLSPPPMPDPEGPTPVAESPSVVTPWAHDRFIPHDADEPAQSRTDTLSSIPPAPSVAVDLQA
ncbi:hypothetical protein EWM64_g898 [Hericium alpestre]|uniref:ubiquitinyl hydrolase 1 n=1 Tax=Hericium alpestre TaxID=135208 RepID=A0A4Z0A9X8_9AGAM|nr:hypothetical protein EWM64_g898 [Hericium alpestre]